MVRLVEKARPVVYRIMVIDDDDNLGVRVTQMLQQAGFRAHFHGRSFGVLNAVREASCDLVLLDVNMPRLDGTSVARMIRDTLGPKRVRVLLYSSMDPGLLEKIAEIVGAQGAVSKRATDEELVQRIHETLGRKPFVGASPGAENAQD